MSESKTVHRVPGGLEFVIEEDGSVTFIKLPPEMIDMALALDPNATLACSTETPDKEAN